MNAGTPSDVMTGDGHAITLKQGINGNVGIRATAIVRTFKLKGWGLLRCNWIMGIGY